MVETNDLLGQTLNCRRCRRVIEPTERMLIVAVEHPIHWTRPDRIAHRLAQSTRWHYRCAPAAMRQYVYEDPPSALYAI